jgi:iron complex transport system substrate-binding protein
MGAGALNGVLPRLNIRQANFTVPATIEESLAQVQRVSILVGHPDRGAALIARIRAAIASAAPRHDEPRLSALIYEYHGLASGPHTLMDELMRRAGFDNVAPRYGMRRTGLVSLESLVARPPQVLLAGRMAPGEPVWADRELSSPILTSLPTSVRRETFPEQLMFCGGPSIIPAMAALARAREDALRGISQ